MDEPPRIDERTFQDLVDGAKRLIPMYCPEWTNHGPTDPGIAILEVVAWLAEQLVHRINEVPARVHDELLRLIGLERFPAQAASAHLLFRTVSSLEQQVVIPAGTVVGTLAGDGEDGTGVDFQTDRTLTLHPVDAIGLLTVTGDGAVVAWWEDLTSATSDVEVFGDVAPGSAMVLGLTRPCADHVLQVEVDAWIEGIGIDPRSPPIVWEASTDMAWVPVRVLSDETGGLTRAGSVVLRMPDAHDEIGVAGRRGAWLRARIVSGESGTPAFRTSPRLRSLAVQTIGGVVRATHSSPMAREYLGTTDGTAGLSFRTSRRPVLPLSAEEWVEVGGEPWQLVGDFSSSGPDDAHVTFDAETGTVRFGPAVRGADGSIERHGGVPAAGCEVCISGYRVGGGAVGNVGAETLRVLKQTVPYIASVGNPEPAWGGVDAESSANAELRAPLWLQTGDRAVTADDFERIAMWAHPGVARVRCVEGDGLVRLLVVPHGASVLDASLDDLALPSELADRLAAHIDERRLLGTRVEIGTPVYQGVSPVARVRARPGRNLDAVGARCIDELARFLHPLAGGTDGSGWPFERDVDAISLATRLSAVDGVERVEEVLVFEADLRVGRRLGYGMERVLLGRDALPLSFRPQVVVA
jgi:predicted phage baseplate assembly protein